jgi:hypothetical protein
MTERQLRFKVYRALLENVLCGLRVRCVYE